MRLSLIYGVAAVAGALAATADSAVPNSPHRLFKRWDIDLCNLCLVPKGTLVPFKDSYTLPLEGDRQDRCYDICVGGLDVNSETTKVCWENVGYGIYVNFSSFVNFDYVSVGVFAQLDAYGNPDDTTPQFTTENHKCTVAADADTAKCFLSYAALTGAATKPLALDGMCPGNADDTNMINFAFSGKLQATDSGAYIGFSQRYPCDENTYNRTTHTCSEYDKRYNRYFQVGYSCLTCPDLGCPSLPGTTASTLAPSTTPASSAPSSKPISSTSTRSSSTKPSSSSCSSTKKPSSSSSSRKPSSSSSAKSSSTKPIPSHSRSTSTKRPPTPTPTCTKALTCPYGTAVGWRAGGSDSGCHSFRDAHWSCARAGYYLTPTAAQLSRPGGFNGSLVVEHAGSSETDRAWERVAVFHAALTSEGKVDVALDLVGDFVVARVDIDIGCTPVPEEKCDPAGYAHHDKGKAWRGGSGGSDRKVGQLWVEGDGGGSEGEGHGKGKGEHEGEQPGRGRGGRHQCPHYDVPKTCKKEWYIIISAEISKEYDVPCDKSDKWECPSPIDPRTLLSA